MIFFIWDIHVFYMGKNQKFAISNLDEARGGSRKRVSGGRG